LAVRPRVLVLALLLAMGIGCAPKSPDARVWTDQARHAVTDAQGEVATAQLVLRQQQEDRLPQNYQQIVLIDSEESVGTTAESFSSVQPPPGTDATYENVTAALSDASDVVAATRIAVVRDDTAAYSKLLRQLAEVSDDLDEQLRELNP
jgi:hypothetical protein